MHHNRTQKQLRYFFVNILPSFHFGYLGHVCPLPSKIIMPNMIFICMHKMSYIPDFVWDIVKILQTCHFEHFENTWSCLSTKILSPFFNTFYLFFLKILISFFKILLLQKIQIKFMTDYSENVFHLNDCFVFKGSAVSENEE